MKLDEIKDPRLVRRIQQAMSGVEELKKDIAQVIPKKKRIRQRSSDGLNKLERQAMLWLSEQYAHASLRPHAIRLEIANGCTFTPDIVMVRGADMILYEVKGDHAWDDAIVKLKVVARQWPHLNFALIWKQDGQWMEQAILP